MNDKDKEAFEIWWKKNGKHQGEGYAIVKEYSLCKEVWEAACEYKQAKVNEAELREAKTNRGFVELASKFCALQNENAELKQKLSTIWKEAEKFYLDD
jgi:hypothetical protein